MKAGKSILNYFPSVIEHHSYKGEKVELTEQVVWIKVDCPNNSSVSDLCAEILANLDLVMGREKTRLATSIPRQLRQIEQSIKSSFLGILVIDEMQRLVFKRTGGENNLLNFLHSLVNKLGVPLLFCANPPFDDTLAKSLKAARRAESAGYFEMEQLRRNSPEWDAFIGELWEIQWTNVHNELTEELKDKMYDLSLGNLDIAHRIYREAQRLVILANSDDETINTAVLEEAYSQSCRLSSRTEEVQGRRAELVLPGKNRGSSTKDSQPPSNRATSALADITRPQHFEFEFQIKELVNAVNLRERVMNPCLIQEQQFLKIDAKNPVLQSLICDNPLYELQ